MNTRRILLAAVSSVAFGAASLAGAGMASATPTGLTGAMNMVNTMGTGSTDAYSAMVNTAMVSDNSNGRQGMWCAVYITLGTDPPSSCH